MNRLIIGTLVAAALGLATLAGADRGGSGPASPDMAAPAGLAEATFAGGCFWCTESDFEKVPGVAEVLSGYTGGTQENPNYQQVASGSTSHLESVLVRYDPAHISYEQLLEAFWRMVDPTDEGGQFVDRGHQYSTAIFYHDEAQRAAAEASRARLAASGLYKKPIVTPIRPASRFYVAEAYHQDYYQQSPLRYKFYRLNSGRDQYLEKTWGEELHVDYSKPTATAEPRYGKPANEVLREKLTPLQYKVTQKEGTEPPYDNSYWNLKQDGIYVDIVSGEPLFSSTDKFDSGTGWPSFTRPLVAEHVVENTDYKLIFPRTEVRSRFADSHLGHVFKDGPAPTGLRYCINSASLRFVPKEDLEMEGYGEFTALFK